MRNPFSLCVINVILILGLAACAPLATPTPIPATPLATRNSPTLAPTDTAQAISLPTDTAQATVAPTAVAPATATAPVVPYPPPISPTPLPPTPTREFPLCPKPAVAPLGFIGNNRLVSYSTTGNYPNDGVNIFNLDTQQEEDFLAYPTIPFGLAENVYKTPNSTPLGIALAPDGQTLAWALTSTIQLINLPDKTVRNTLAPISAPVSFLAFSPTGDQLHAVLADGTLQTWTMDGELLNSVHPAVRPFAEGLNNVVGLGVAPDGHTLALLGSELVLWDLTTQQPKTRYAVGPLGDAYFLTFPANIAFSPDGQLVGHGTGYGPGPASIWQVANGQLAWQAKRTTTNEALGEVEMSGIAFAPNGQWLAVAEDKNDTATVSLYSVAGTTLGQSRTLPKPAKVQYADYQFIFSPDSTRLVALVYTPRQGPEPIYWLVWDIAGGTLEYVCEVDFLHY